MSFVIFIYLFCAVYGLGPDSASSRLIPKICLQPFPWHLGQLGELLATKGRALQQALPQWVVDGARRQMEAGGG